MAPDPVEPDGPAVRAAKEFSVAALYVFVRLLICVVLLTWLLLLISLTGLISFVIEHDPTSALVIFGVSVAIVCGLLWVADVVEAIRLPQGARRAIFSVFIISVLATCATHIASKLISPEVPVINGITLLTTDDPIDDPENPPVFERRSSDHYRGFAHIHFLIDVSSLAMDDQGAIDVILQCSLEDKTADSSTIRRVEMRGYPTAEFTSVANTLLDDSLQVNAVGGHLLRVISVSPHLLKDFEGGSLELHVIAFDRVRQTFSQERIQRISITLD